MKKLHKTGIAIISALAPAAALGITAGVVVASLPKGEDKTVTKETWLEAYDKVSTTHQTSFKIYDKSQITLTVDGDEKTIISVHDYFEHSLRQPREAYIVFKMSSTDDTTDSVSISTPTYDDMEGKIESATSCKYEMDDGTLSIEMYHKDGSTIKYVINSLGYILSYDLSNGKGGEEKHYAVKYDGDLKEINDYTVDDYYDDGECRGYYSSWLQLEVGRQYTFTIDVKDDISIDTLDFFDSDGNSYDIYTNSGLTVSIDGTQVEKGNGWEWNDNGDAYWISFDPAITQGKTIKLEFKLTNKSYRGLYVDAYEYYGH